MSPVHIFEFDDEFGPEEFHYPWPKEILAQAQAGCRRSYLKDEIILAASRCEPRRSQELRALRLHTLGRVRSKLHRYREVVREMRQGSPPEDHEIGWTADGAVSLLRQHLFSEFSNLMHLDDIQSHQLDLFEC